ncbi:MAG: Internalin-like protein (LPXTG motif) Lmo0331 homolog, partial [uncultured Aureispira sp.]
NSSLTCISVDNVTYSTTNWTNVDSGTSFNTNCNISSLIVYIPDANFKAYLVGSASINTNGDAEIQVTEASAFSGVINCPNMNIADLTGVEAFVNLRQLKCYRNHLTSLDVRQNPNLVMLHCANNSIGSLDVRQNTGLTRLFCSNNSISSLDVSQNTSLEKLYCGYTQLSSLNLVNNPSLDVLDCSSSQLSSLNVKNGNNTAIATFKARNNSNLLCIEVDDVAYSTTNWADIDATATFSVNCGANPTARMGTVANTNTTVKSYLISDADNATQNLMDLSAYPNPTRSNLTVDFGKVYEGVNIQVRNLTGQIILTKSLPNTSTTNLELEGAAGVYFVTIQTEVGTQTLKVIKE